MSSRIVVYTTSYCGYCRRAERLLEQDSVRPFEMRGKPMKGWLRVDEAGFATEEQLRDWVDRSVEFARTLPAK